MRKRHKGAGNHPPNPLNPPIDRKSCDQLQTTLLLFPLQGVPVPVSGTDRGEDDPDAVNKPVDVRIEPPPEVPAADRTTVSGHRHEGFVQIVVLVTSGE